MEKINLELLVKIQVCLQKKQEFEEESEFIKLSYIII